MSLEVERKKSNEEREKDVKAIISRINTKAGKIVIGRISDSEEIRDRLKVRFIPTPSKELNAATGGGFPRRRCTIIAGKHDSGKTSLALETIAKNMKEDSNFWACWIESESSLTEEYLVDTFGIDINRFIYVPAEKSMSAETVLDIAETIVSAGICDMLVINSLKCLVPSKEQKASLNDALVAIQARMNARMSRKFTPLVAEKDVAFIIITHLSTDINSMSRDPLIIAGGGAIQYWSALTLDLRKRSLAEKDIISAQDGVKIGFTIRKNHCCPDKFPYVKGEYYALFGKGIETMLSSIPQAISCGVLEEHGAWLWWMENGEAIEKFNGKGAFRTYMEGNPDQFKKYENMIDGTYEAINKELSEEEVAAILEEEAVMEKQAKNVIDLSDKAEKKKKKKKAS